MLFYSHSQKSVKIFTIFNFNTAICYVAIKYKCYLTFNKTIIHYIFNIFYYKMKYYFAVIKFV